MEAGPCLWYGALRRQLCSLDFGDLQPQYPGEPVGAFLRVISMDDKLSPFFAALGRLVLLPSK